MHPTDDLHARGLLACARALTAPPRPKSTWADAMRKDSPHSPRCNDVIRTLRAMNEVDAGIVAAMEAMDREPALPSFAVQIEPDRRPYRDDLCFL